MRVFVLEDDAYRIERFHEECRTEGHDLTLTDHLTGARGAYSLYTGPYDRVYLDHDLGQRQFVDSADEETGAAFVRWMPKATDLDQPEIIVHSYNPDGAREMVRGLREKGYRHVVAWPFGDAVLNTLRSS